MLKTPPKLAGLGIALTMCAIGAGGAVEAGQMADSPDHQIYIEINSQDYGLMQIEFAPEAPEAREVEPTLGWNC